MFICRLIVFSLGFLVSQQLRAEPDPDPAGWLWYKEKKEIEKEPQTPEKTFEKKETPEVSQKDPTAVERLAVLQQSFEEAKAEAILNPTLENVTKTRRLHDHILNISSDFQKSWTISEILDAHSIIPQTSPGALQVKRDLEEKDLDQKLQSLSKTHGLLFVFSQTCPYCEGFAPLVVKFARQYGFSVDGLSSGEGCYEGMTCTQNRNAVQAINPDGAFPLLFLVNPATGDVIPLARGYVSWSDLMMNVKQILKYLDERTGVRS